MATHDEPTTCRNTTRPLLRLHSTVAHLLFVEELLDDPHEGVVVLRAVDFGHESAPLLQVLGRHLQGMQGDFVLLVGVLLVGCSHVGCPVAQDHICLQPVGIIALQRTWASSATTCCRTVDQFSSSISFTHGKPHGVSFSKVRTVIFTLLLGLYYTVTILLTDNTRRCVQGYTRLHIHVSYKYSRSTSSSRQIYRVCHEPQSSHVQAVWPSYCATMKIRPALLATTARGRCPAAFSLLVSRLLCWMDAVHYLPCLHLALERSAALVGGDIVDERLYVGDGPNGQQINTQNDASARHELRCNLAPSAWGRTEVDADLRRAEKVILLVDLVG